MSGEAVVRDELAEPRQVQNIEPPLLEADDPILSTGAVILTLHVEDDKIRRPGEGAAAGLELRVIAHQPDHIALEVTMTACPQRRLSMAKRAFLW